MSMRGGSFFCRATGVMVAWVLMTGGSLAQPDSNPRDTLVYKDGDRVQGHLLRHEGALLVFQSDRFGEQRVPESEAVVIMAEKPAEPLAATTANAAPGQPAAPAGKVAEKAKEKAEEKEEEQEVSIWDRFSPWVLTAKVRNYFGPWHGKFAFATEVVSDTADRTNTSLEAHMQRKWKRDEVQLNSRYDFSETNQLTTTDVVRADASWRHDFNQSQFAQYRPTVEWNRANFVNGVPSDYVLLQQEIGAGYTVLAKPTSKVRVGLSENLFDTWTMGPTASHNSRVAESGFVETEFTLPWRMKMTQRAVLYNPFTNTRTAWENWVELSKKLTETLSISLRHEVRKNNPDGSAQDYQRLRFMLGLDF